MTDQAALPMRPIRIGALDVSIDARPDGTIYVRPSARLAPYPTRLTDRLHHWAALAPDRTFLAERDRDGGWRTVSYAETLSAVRRIGAALLKRGLSAERPLAILSGNSVNHALLGLAAMYVGVPYCPVSPAYSLVSRDYGKLKHAFALLTPGLVYADDAASFGAAVEAAAPPDVEIIFDGEPFSPRRATAFSDLHSEPAALAVDHAHEHVGPETIAKFLLTSGSTGAPKAVINTQRMLCSNQVMLRELLALMQDEPPVILDWLPWNHTFGGNHNVGLVLYNGGSLYIDEGKPTPAGIGATIRNLMEIAPTIYFNVPKGFELLVPHLTTDRALRKTFYSRLQLTFFAGAGLAPHVWSALDELALAETGTRLPMLTGLGATETAPFSLSCTPETSRSGHVGLPVPGNELKLAPKDGKLEARVKGPNVTPGYWRRPDLTAEAFDEEGYYRFGDALRFVDERDIRKGFAFDGRIAEDFKLASGTWVSVGPLRARVIAACAPLVRDVVIAGLDRDAPAALAFPDLDACRAFCVGLPPDAPLSDVLGDARLRRALSEGLRRLAAESTGSSTRATRLMLLEDPPSIDLGEMTDKGSINQRAVLRHRADLVARLYAATPPDEVICIEEKVSG